MDDHPGDYDHTSQFALERRLDELQELIGIMEALPDRPTTTTRAKGYTDRPWTDPEDILLIDFFETKVPSYVAKTLKRSLRSCYDRFYYLKHERKLGACE